MDCLNKPAPFADSGSMSFDVVFESSESHWNRVFPRIVFGIGAPGSTVKYEFSGISIASPIKFNGTMSLTVTDIDLISITPSDWHEGSD